MTSLRVYDLKGKYCFKENNTCQYKENIASLFTNDFLHSFMVRIDNTTNTVESITESLVNVLNECAQCCYRPRKLNTKIQPQWFDEKCKTLKAEKCRLLRQYRLERNDANLTAYKQGRNRFNSYCNIQQNIHNKTLLDDLVSNSSNPKSFWNKLKILCNSRQQTRHGASTEDLYSSKY